MAPNQCYSVLRQVPEAMKEHKELVPYSLRAMLQTRTDSRFDSCFVALVKVTCDQADATTYLRAQMGGLEGQLADSHATIDQLIQEWGYLVDLCHVQERMLVEMGVKLNVIKKQLYQQLHGNGWTDPKTGRLRPGLLELFDPHWKENDRPCLAMLNCRRHLKDSRASSAKSKESAVDEETNAVAAAGSATAVDLIDGDESSEVFVTEQELREERTCAFLEACKDKEADGTPATDSASDQEPIVEVGDSESDFNKSPSSRTESDSVKRPAPENPVPFVSPDGGPAPKKNKPSSPSTGDKGLPKRDDAYD